MKQLTCEMCGSTDLIKQDGVFVCQSCGCKYSVEEAKKLMVEGTVKIDTSDELKNLYEVARRAKEAKNNGNAAKYYDMILVKDPSSWEANFYTVYFQAMSCKIAEIASAATAVNNCIGSTFILIRDNVIEEEERKRAIKEVQESAYDISDMLYSAATNHYEGIDESIRSNYFMEYLGNVLAAGGIKGELCSQLCDCFANDEGIFSTLGIDILKKRINEGIGEQFVEQYTEKIRKYEPGYMPPEKKEKPTETATTSTAQSTSSGGCYVATAVYGSYDCPQVWTLRRYRDFILAKTWLGRAFIHAYYAISPTIVKWFGHTGWFKQMWKGTLDRMVERLNADGVADTPYRDKTW